MTPENELRFVRAIEKIANELSSIDTTLFILGGLSVVYLFAISCN